MEQSTCQLKRQALNRWAIITPSLPGREGSQRFVVRHFPVMHPPRTGSPVSRGKELAEFPANFLAGRASNQVKEISRPRLPPGSVLPGKHLKGKQMMKNSGVYVVLLAVVMLASCAQEPRDHMGLAKLQLKDISRDYLQKRHPDWAKQLDQTDQNIVVVERRECWEVHFAMPVEDHGRTAVVRLAKGTLEPLGTFHE